MNERARKLPGALAGFVLLGLSIADFADDGRIADTLVGALLALALGAGASGLDRFLRERRDEWLDPDRDR